jgi:hypothetical protein
VFTTFPAGVDRPLSIAEIADRSITLVVMRWRTLLMLVLAEAVPIGILRMLVPDRMSTVLVWFVPDIGLAALVYGAAVYTTAAPDVPSFMTVLRAATRRYGSFLASLIVSWLYVLLIALAVLIASWLATLLVAGAQNPSLAVAAGFAILVLGFAAFLPRAGLVAMIVIPIVALEERSPWRALSTAFRRVQNAGKRRAWLLSLAVFAIGSAPPLLLSFALDPFDRDVPVLRLLEELLGDACSLGAGVVVATVVALEMRVRYEGFDLELCTASSSQTKGDAFNPDIDSAGSA